MLPCGPLRSLVARLPRCELEGVPTPTPCAEVGTSEVDMELPRQGEVRSPPRGGWPRWSVSLVLLCQLPRLTAASRAASMLHSRSAKQVRPAYKPSGKGVGRNFS